MNDGDGRCSCIVLYCIRFYSKVMNDIHSSAAVLLDDCLSCTLRGQLNEQYSHLVINGCGKIHLQQQQPAVVQVSLLISWKFINSLDAFPWDNFQELPISI